MQHEHHQQHGTKAQYNLIFAVLFVVTILELIASELAGIPGYALLIMLTFTKGALVAAYYMHLKYDPPIFTWIFVVPMIMGLAVVLSMQGLAGY